MSRFYSYISSASQIIEAYTGDKPLVHHLRAFFAGKKKYGSRDRRIISSLCYCFFRPGKSLKDIDIPRRIILGYFLSESSPSDLLEELHPELNIQVGLNIADKLALLHIEANEVFPFFSRLPDDIDNKSYALSFFYQPYLYIRIRPGKKEVVINQLKTAAIPFETCDKDCLQLPSSTSLDAVLKINKDVVIQDLNSQRVLRFLQTNPGHFTNKQKLTAWDCCAASGGKSIMLYDILDGNVQLTVSDIRENMLLNLAYRLQASKIPIYKKFAADLTLPPPLASSETFNIIICDAPCTGSGTWSRSPEQLYFFNEDKMAVFTERQKKIVSSIIPHLSPGGLLFYITCSVFTDENEGIVDFLQQHHGLSVLQMEYMPGYEKRADTMFVAVLTR